MALREFTDPNGREWQVWATRPATGVVRGHFEHGWLTFEHMALRRRLAPVPDDWEELPDQALMELCTQARPEPPRKRLVE